MDKPKQHDAWFRGPIPGVLPPLQPAAATLIQAREEIEKLCAALSREDVWSQRGTAAPVGFHLRHLAGSTSRLLSSAQGLELTEQQVAALKQEKEAGTESAAELIARVQSALDAALEVLRRASEDSLYLPREMGRARLPATAIGLLFHAAEHAYRHCGQIATTLKMQPQRHEGTQSPKVK